MFLILILLLLFPCVAHAQVGLGTGSGGVLPPASLTGYPSDATKFLNGNGAWTVPSGSGTTAGYINTPTVTTGAATLLAQCTSPGCTDYNRVANGTNTSTLALTTPAASGMHDGEAVDVEIDMDGTHAPSSITWTGGTSVTLNYGVLGNAGTATVCGTPSATGQILAKWQWNSSTGDLTLRGCGPVPAATALGVALGGTGSTTGGLFTTSSTNSSVFGIGFDFIGTPTASMIEATNLVYEISVPANYATPTSSCTCGTNPSETDAYTVKCNGTSQGTFSLSTSCVLTLPTNSAYTCTAGQRFEMDAPATVSGKDIACTVAYTR